MSASKRSSAKKSAQLQPEYNHGERSRLLSRLGELERELSAKRAKLAAAELLIHRALRAGQADPREADRILREARGPARPGRGVRFNEEHVLGAYRTALTHGGGIETDRDALIEQMLEMSASNATVADGLPPERPTYIATPLKPAEAVHAIARAFGTGSAEGLRVWLGRRKTAARKLQRAGKLPVEREWIADLELPSSIEVFAEELKQVPQNL